MHATMECVIINLIEEFKSNIGGQLVDRGRVVDQLLDLRLAAHDQPQLTSFIDQLLGSLPGRTVVEAAWWAETLDRLVEAATPQPVL
jgi:hypothetical protein